MFAAHASSRANEAVVVTCSGPLSFSDIGSPSVPPCDSDIPRRRGSSSHTSRAGRPTSSDTQWAASSPADVAVDRRVIWTGTSAGPVGSRTVIVCSPAPDSSTAPSTTRA